MPSNEYLPPPPAGRAVDRTVASVVDSITRLLPPDQQRLVPVALALAPAAATSLRVAYEIGDFITRTAPQADHQGALNLANHCVGIILEEAQRFLFGRFLQAGLRRLEHLITQDVPGLAPGVWDALMPKRQALATTLIRMPAEPFQPMGLTDEFDDGVQAFKPLGMAGHDL